MPAQYSSDYDPSTDPFGGSAHCEHIADQLAGLFGLGCHYEPSEDGRIVEFHLSDEHGVLHTIRATCDTPQGGWFLL